MNKNNKRKCCRNKRNVPAAGLKENNIDFDYDKFAEAIIKAEKKISEEKIRKQKEEDEKNQNILNQYIDLPKSKFLTANLYRTFKLLKTILKLRKEKIIDLNATSILFNFVSSCLLGAYRIFFIILAISPIVLICLEKNLKFLCLLPFSILFIFIERLLNLVNSEIEETTDINFIMSVFNAVIAFTAMVLTIITVILTAITLYTTINPSSGLIPL